jgi:DNA-directed RNA polymerase subunit RPC12/RpoP
MVNAVPPLPSVARFSARLVCSGCGSRAPALSLSWARWCPFRSAWLAYFSVRCPACGRRRLVAAQANTPEAQKEIREMLNIKTMQKLEAAFARLNPWYNMADVETLTALDRRLNKAMEMHETAVVWAGFDPEKGHLWQVNSQTDKHLHYIVSVKAGCTCPDALHAPQGWCKHRLAAWIHRQQLQKGHAIGPDVEQTESAPASHIS